MNWSRRGLLSATALLLAGCGGTDSPSSPASITLDRGGYVAGTPLDGIWSLPDVTLTDTTGAEFNLRTSPTAKAVLLFFGYSNCPDVCTGIIADLAQAVQRAALGEQAAIIVVTTDPARDTPQVLGEYLRRIDPAVVGLTGELESIVAAGETLGVFIKEGRRLPSGGYEVDHSTQVLGFGAERTAQVVWTSGTSIGNYMADITTLVDAQ